MVLLRILGNLKVAGDISSKSISRTDEGADWLRINDATNNVGRTALYGNLSINGTQKGLGGLVVGTWGDSNIGEGNIKATGNITAGGNVTTGGLTTAKKINLQFDKWENNLLDNKHAYIVNDNTNYKALMIAGNDVKVTGVREVQIYDNLTVTGNLKVNGTLTVKNLVVEDNLDLGTEKRPFYKYNNGQDYVELHGLPYWSRGCHNDRRGIHTGCNLRHAIS